jgi:hypothetical protein
MLFVRGKLQRDLITKDDSPSSMRFSMIVILELIVISVFAMLLIFLYEAAYCDDISFQDAGYFLGGLAALFGVSAGAKAVQKRQERPTHYNKD